VTSSGTLYLLLPEIILILIATAIYLGGAFTTAREGWSWLAAAGLLLAGLAVHQQQDVLAGAHTAAKQTAETPAAAKPAADMQLAGEAPTAAEPALLSGPIVVDQFTQTTRWFSIGVGLLFVLLSARSAAKGLAPEFVGSLLLIIAGLMIIAGANDLVLLFMGLEMVSIPTYVVLYLGRNDTASQEAATKYFFLSILSSGLLLYGFSFFYGFHHSTSLIELSQAAAGGPQSNLAPFAKLAMVLIFAGLGFRLTLAPFHFYAPDVYQGTSHSNAALLSVVPKIAGLAALIRLVVAPMGDDLPALAKLGGQLSIVLAMLTMTVGNLLALWQQNLRRMLAYSSIAHAGYMLIGIAVAFAATAEGARVGPAAAGFAGVGATLFYLATYAAATIAAFAALAYLSNDDRQINTLDDLAGLFRSHPVVAAAIAVSMFSLTGLPPLAGFWGKFVLINGALSFEPGDPARDWFIGLSILAMVNAAISAGYYLRVIATMYFREQVAVVRAQGGPSLGAALLLSTVVVLLIGFWPNPWRNVAQEAGQSAQASVERHVAAETALSREPGAAGSLAVDGDVLSVGAGR